MDLLKIPVNSNAVDARILEDVSLTSLDLLFDYLQGNSRKNELYFGNHLAFFENEFNHAVIHTIQFTLYIFVLHQSVHWQLLYTSMYYRYNYYYQKYYYVVITRNTCNYKSVHWRISKTTVPTFSSCSKCVGRPVIIYNHTPNCYPVSLAWMTS